MLVRGRKLIVISGFLFLGLAFFMFDRASGKTAEVVQSLRLSNSGYERAHALAFSSDGKYLAVGGLSGIYVFDFQELSVVRFIETNSWARSLVFLADTHKLAVGLFDHSLKIWDIPGSQLLQTLEGHQGWVRSIAISGDGSVITSASDDDTLRVWDANTGLALLVIDQATTGIRAVALSPDGKLVAGALRDHTVRVWDIPSGRLRYTLLGHTDWVRCLAFSPDGQSLASGAFDKNILLWNLANGQLQKTLSGHSSSVLGVAFSPDGKRLASASVDRSVRVWDVQEGSQIQVLPGHTDFVYSVAFSPDGKTLASGAGDNTVRLWDLEALEQNPDQADTANSETPSDCRVCHHRRGTFDPAPVIELSCEACHVGGANFAWCANFPQSFIVDRAPISYHHVEEFSGIPVSDENVAVLITSPSNGETLYVKGDYLVPEVISGIVFYSNQASISAVKVQLDILSGEQKTASLVTTPSANGEFSFNIDLNPDSMQAQSPNLFCRGCHEKVGSGTALPHGEVHIIVTAATPDGEKAIDERWFSVDSSEEAAISVKIQDEATGEPITDLLLSAATILYEWRSRTVSTVTDSAGIARLNLESLSQAATTYELSIPEQVVNGRLYTSDDRREVVLEPGKTGYSRIIMTAQAQTGSLSGSLSGVGAFPKLENTDIWAFEQPGGPIYQASLTSQDTFAFENLPIDQYLVFADPGMLIVNNLSAELEMIDLAKSPQGSIELAAARSQSIAGNVTTQDGGSLPFAWVTVGNDNRVIPINPISGEYLVLDQSPAAKYLTISAPGYYSLTQPANPDGGLLSFELVPRPDLQRITWGDGELFLFSKSDIKIEDLTIDLLQGWLWGSGGAARPLKINLPDMELIISSGGFALEKPENGDAWLYVYQGSAQIALRETTNLIAVKAGEMIALIEDAVPIPLNASIAAGLHPELDEAPVPEVNEPSLKAQVKNMLVKMGSTAAQVTTLTVYIVSLAVVIGIPLAVLFFRKKHK